MTTIADIRAPEISSADIVEAARNLRPLLQHHAEACDRDGQVPQPVVDAMRDAGLFKILLPKRLGGLGLPFITMLEAAAELGYACGSSAWVQLVLCSTTGVSGLCPRAVTGSVFRTGDEAICGVVMQNGTARAVADGYIVTGKWPFASGSFHADWATVALKMFDAGGNMTGPGWAYIPLRGEGALRIEESWNVIGMRGTGSNTLIAEEIFVPRHMVVPLHMLKADIAPEEIEPIDRWPPAAYAGLGLTGPILGAAQAIFDIVSARIHSRPVTYWKYEHQSDSHVILEALGEAQMEIDSAWLHTRAAAAYLDVIAQQRELTLLERARIPANGGYIMRLLRRATERLMDIAGASGFVEGSPIQRLWRDINFASRHAGFNTGAGLECYGRALTGLELNASFLPPKA